MRIKAFLLAAISVLLCCILAAISAGVRFCGAAPLALGIAAVLTLMNGFKIFVAAVIAGTIAVTIRMQRQQAIAAVVFLAVIGIVIVQIAIPPGAGGCVLP